MSVTVKYFRDYLLYLSILSLALVYVMPPASVKAQGGRYYVGYYFKREEWSAPILTTGEIKFVHASGFPSYGHFAAAFMCIILDYEPNLYWIQSGLDQMRVSGGVIQRRFYVEVTDSQHEDDITYIEDITPEDGHTYTFTICKVRFQNKYHVTIHEGITQLYSGYYYVNPYLPRDHQAFVETSSSDIDIGTVHFSDLKYRSSRYTRYWYTHEPLEISPYDLDEISDHEFKASR